jgi:hypothetical protein
MGRDAVRGCTVPMQPSVDGQAAVLVVDSLA